MEENSKIISKALSFDDVLLVPQKSSCLPSDVQLKTHLGNLQLNMPLIAAAMDSVCEARLAVKMSLLGGLGVIHKNMSPVRQVNEVKKVKSFQNAIILNPVTVSPEDSVEDLYQKTHDTGITGFPVVDSQGKLVGMCTRRDIRYVDNMNLKIKEVMSTPVKFMQKDAKESEAKLFFKTHKIEKLPLVDESGRLSALMTSKDFKRVQKYPLAIRDQQGRLMSAAAVGVGEFEGLERTRLLVEAGLDVVVVDSAHGHSDGVIQTAKQIKQEFPDLKVVAGNIATKKATQALIEVGVDVVKIGIGPGSICTTRMVTGVGIPQFSAVLEVSDYVKEIKSEKVGVIADGGIKLSGDITKAIGAGADAVMIGSLLAGTDESPGDMILWQGRSYKAYRGMGSLGAMKEGSGGRYFQGKIKERRKFVPEGVEARVPYRGPLEQVIYQLCGGLRSGMGYVGAANIKELKEKAQFVKISNSALRESHVHDVAITAEAPNYSIG